MSTLFLVLFINLLIIFIYSVLKISFGVPSTMSTLVQVTINSYCQGLWNNEKDIVSWKMQKIASGRGK